MWTCPGCGREFRKTNQGHYCGKAPENTDEYIALQIAEAQMYLEELRRIMGDCIPEVRERIAWSMPVFENDRLTISMAACKKHISLYVNAEIVELFKDQTAEYAINKNTVYLPYDKELPVKPLEDILKQYFRDV